MQINFFKAFIKLGNIYFDFLAIVHKLVRSLKSLTCLRALYILICPTTVMLVSVWGYLVDARCSVNQRNRSLQYYASMNYKG